MSNESGGIEDVQQRDLPADTVGDLLHQAVKYNNFELLETLLNAQEKRHINIVHNDGETALYIAVSNCYKMCCHLLLEHGGKLFADVQHFVICDPDVIFINFYVHS